MPIINFSISDRLAQEIKETMEEWNFVTKAEFFRHAAADYIERLGKKNKKQATH